MLLLSMMNLQIDPNWKRIGISLSGGADSALLSYLILKNTDADIYFTTQVRMWKTRPWQRYIAQDVVAWFKERFNNRIEHIEGFIPPEMEEPHTTYITDEYGMSKPGNRIILRSHNEYISHLYNFDSWFSAVNQNPPIKFDGALEDRDIATIPEYDTHLGITICHPFVHTTKDWIIKKYDEENILDLLNITRSCEGEFEGLDYTTYTPGQSVPICGECFWCKEREWAIEQNK